jgi:CarboxypepD_reg-like domain
MKKIVIFFAALLSVWSAFGQEIEITGQIKDEITKTPLEFCYVFTFNDKDSMVVSVVTDENGYFTIPIEKGTYKFAFSNFGYIPDTTFLKAYNESKFLDVFKLTPDENIIGDVVIEGETFKLEIDKDVKILTSDMKKGSSNSYDVLDKVGGLHYDRYNNKMTVDNDDNIIIIVNGIEKNRDYIKNLAPDRLQKVEIIRDPSGKYGLAGYSAVINIILKSDYKGTDLNLSAFTITTPINQTIDLLPFWLWQRKFEHYKSKIKFLFRI